MTETKLSEKELRVRKEAERASLARMGGAILKKKLGVNWLPENSGELGFTRAGNPPVVNVFWHEDEFCKDLSTAEEATLRMGVFAHETLHQVFTAFKYTDEVMKGMSNAEAGILMAFANTIEDPAIEFFAPQVFGGRLLDALRFSIKHIYVTSGPIDDSKDAFTQLVNALVFFGDMGIVKGNFTFPEAYEYFKKVAPLYNEAITCPFARRRIDIAKECMEITRPLWEELVKQQEFMEELMKELAEFLKKLEAGGNGEDADEDAKDSASTSGAGERRKSFLKSLEDESSDAGGSDGDNEGDADGDSEAESGKESDGNSDEESNESTSGSLESTEEGSDKEKDSKASSSSSEESGRPSGEKPECSGKGCTMNPDEADSIAEEELFVDEDTIEKIEESIERDCKKAREEINKESGGNEPLPDFDIESPFFRGGVKCLNRRITCSAQGARYNALVGNHKAEIKALTKHLEKIFNSDRETIRRCTSGSYNIKRGTIGTTATIFDKRKDKGNVSDVEIFLLVDQSGSMYGENIEQARNTAVIFAEALTKLKIPYYIMGFQADTYGNDAVHNHFVTWKGSKSERETLVAMDAGSNNFDGYSIRYAGNILKSRAAANKLLFVISDGSPAARAYSGMQGIVDTTNAIKEVRKFATVFGIALGEYCGPEVLHSMYGADFIHCKEQGLLAKTLCKKLEKTISKKCG